MKRLKIYILTLLIICFSVSYTFAQMQQAAVSFSNEEAPKTLTIETKQGDVSIKGYEGKEVKIEATQQNIPSEARTRYGSDNSNLFEVNEANNMIILESISSAEVDYRLEVPQNIFLKINSLDRGNIDIQNTSGFIEINNQSGEVLLQKIKGWAVVQAVDGRIEADFEQVPEGKTMSFANMNSDVNLYFPKDLQATMRVRSNQNNVINDFEGSISKENFYSDLADGMLLRNEEDKVFEEVEEFSQERDIPKKAPTKQPKKAKPKSSNKSSKKDQKASIEKKNTEPDFSIPSNALQPLQNRQSATQEYQVNGGGTVYFISTFEGRVRIYKK